MTVLYFITPVGKPRMTQRDKWEKRPATQKYWYFKDACKEQGVEIRDEAKITFALPMPKSWSEKKRGQMHLTPHRQKPDIDNLIKGIFDAVLEDDSVISQIHARKIWAPNGYIIISLPPVSSRDGV